MAKKGNHGNWGITHSVTQTQQACYVKVDRKKKPFTIQRRKIFRVSSNSRYLSSFSLPVARIYHSFLWLFLRQNL